MTSKQIVEANATAVRPTRFFTLKFRAKCGITVVLKHIRHNLLDITIRAHEKLGATRFNAIEETT